MARIRMLNACRALSTLLCFAILLTRLDAYKTYLQHQLWRLNVTNDEQVNKILEFSRIAHQHGINFWSDEFRSHIPVGHQIRCMTIFFAEYS
jgi:hypothetical protein